MIFEDLYLYIDIIIIVLFTLICIVWAIFFYSQAREAKTKFEYILRIVHGVFPLMILGTLLYLVYKIFLEWIIREYKTFKNLPNK